MFDNVLFFKAAEIDVLQYFAVSYSLLINVGLFIRHPDMHGERKGLLRTGLM